MSDEVYKFRVGSASQKERVKRRGIKDYYKGIITQQFCLFLVKIKNLIQRSSHSFSTT